MYFRSQKIGTPYIQRNMLEEIQIFESKLSVVNMLHMNNATAIVSAIIIGAISLIGILIKAFFVYYVRYKAPKDRPINTMIFFDQVM